MDISEDIRGGYIFKTATDKEYIRGGYFFKPLRIFSDIFVAVTNLKPSRIRNISMTVIFFKPSRLISEDIRGGCIFVSVTVSNIQPPRISQNFKKFKNSKIVLKILKKLGEGRYGHSILVHQNLEHNSS